MGHTVVIDIQDEPRSVKAVAPRYAQISATVGLILLAASWLLGGLRGNDHAHFYHAYLVNYCYFLSISLGALFFLGITNLCSAKWSIVVRRLAEIIAANVAMMALLLLPILLSMFLGGSSLYEWNQSPPPAEVLKKSAYLNYWFFIGRVVFYFGFWIFLARYYLNSSLNQDRTGDPAITDRMKTISAPGLIFFGLTITFAAFDLLMSLTPTWVSTIFGVYYFAGSGLSFFATLILLCVVLQKSGILPRAITVEHYHDLGKFLFGFTFFWGYIAFSQYMLIWYGNLPEETWWYKIRYDGTWRFVSLALIYAHFVIPFVALMGRHVKRTPVALAFWAVWLLVMHWVDLYWVVMPHLHPESNNAPFALLDFLLLFGQGALYLAGLFWVAGNAPLIPERDPALAESLAFRNV